MTGDARSRRGGTGGFTLIEILIALVILSLLMTVLFSGLRLGARTWEAAEERLYEAQEYTLVTALLRDVLEQARPVFQRDLERGNHLVFEGDRDRMQFVSRLPAHHGTGGLSLMELREEQGVLVLKHRLFSDDADETEENEERTEDLAKGFSGLELEYFGLDDEGRMEWVDEWSGRELPNLVRVRFEREEPRGAAATPRLWQEMVVEMKLRVANPVDTGGRRAVNRPLRRRAPGTIRNR